MEKEGKCDRTAVKKVKVAEVGREVRRGWERTREEGSHERGILYHENLNRNRMTKKEASRDIGKMEQEKVM